MSNIMSRHCPFAFILIHTLWSANILVLLHKTCALIFTVLAAFQPDVYRFVKRSQLLVKITIFFMILASYSAGLFV